MIGVQQCAGLFLVVLGRLLAAIQNWPISYQKVLVKLVGILVLKTTGPHSACWHSCRTSVKDMLMNS
jgi:hypothetical protein